MPSDIGSRPDRVKPGEPRGVLPAGTRLRAFEIVSVLGQGAFGITYLARDTQLQRDVAIKEYLPTALAVRDSGTTVTPRSTEHLEEFMWGRDRFLDEARTLARLGNEPSIVRVHEFLKANGTAYMVMALAEGETLQRKLRREGQLASPAVNALLRPLLDGLEQVHAIGFLHRDIKPANIIIDAEGVPTLIDFGASRAAMADRTGALTAVFTPGYAAPEQFTTSRQGPWTDIYGLAATLHHAITGNAPPSAFDRILQDDYRRLESLRPKGFSPMQLRGIDAALSVRAAERPQSIAHWRAALESDEPGPTEVMRRGAAAEVPPVRSSGDRLPSMRKRYALFASMAVAGALLVAGYFVLAPSRQTSVGVAVQGLSAEELTQALEERRKADAIAVEKKRLEEDAQRKAAAEAEAKRVADAELEQARQRRQKAEAELAQLKAEIVAREEAARAANEQAQQAADRRAAEEKTQKEAEAEAAALRRAEQDAQNKASAEAEIKRQADEALAKAQAERQQAEAEAARRAEAEAAKRLADEQVRAKAEADAQAKSREEAKAKAEADAQAKSREEAKAKAEADARAKADADLAAQKNKDQAAETASNIDNVARRRLQVALTALGFDTYGVDGNFGLRSREMIAAWQKARGKPPTGFIAGDQQQMLLKEAAAAVERYEKQQRGPDDERKLSLTTDGRRLVQVALTSLGFDTRDQSGDFGPHTRSMIAAWQKSQRLPETGYLDEAQKLMLDKQGASAIARFKADQQKVEDARKSEAQAARPLASDPPSTAAAATVPTEGRKFTISTSRDTDAVRCGSGSTYRATLYADRIEMAFRHEIKTFAIDQNGQFGGRFSTYSSEGRSMLDLEVRGNVRTKEISVYNFVSRCTWKGSLNF